MEKSNMLRKIWIILIPILIAANIPKRNTVDKDYIITGQNTVQKIYYITSSSFGKVFRGDKAIDNDKDTSWVSKKSDQAHWLELDFGVKRILSKIIVRPGKKNNSNTLKKFNLQFMYKNKWFDFAKVDMRKLSSGKDLWEYDDGKIIFNLVGIDASTFRIYIPEGETFQGYAAIAEIECYIGKAKIKYYDERLKGLYFPIKHGFLPTSDYSYPNAPRKYRGGRHVGLDVYYYYEEDDDNFTPVSVTKKTPVYSAADGVIIRADWNYKAMTAQEWNSQSAYFRKNPRTFVRRSFGGIQVWIDHGNGVVTTYNHLSKMDSDIKVGYKVDRGERIGWVGNSGLLGEAQGKNYGVHLHFEIWVDGYYLGYGMDMKSVKKYVKWIFFDLQ